VVDQIVQFPRLHHQCRHGNRLAKLVCHQLHALSTQPHQPHSRRQSNSPCSHEGRILAQRMAQYIAHLFLVYLEPTLLLFNITHIRRIHAWSTRRMAMDVARMAGCAFSVRFSVVYPL
jgi:hypothetical protein